MFAYRSEAQFSYIVKGFVNKFCALLHEYLKYNCSLQTNDIEAY